MTPEKRLRELADAIGRHSATVEIPRRFHENERRLVTQLGPDLRAVLEELRTLRAQREGGDRG